MARGGLLGDDNELMSVWPPQPFIHLSHAAVWSSYAPPIQSKQRKWNLDREDGRSSLAFYLIELLFGAPQWADSLLASMFSFWKLEAQEFNFHSQFLSIIVSRDYLWLRYVENGSLVWGLLRPVSLQVLDNAFKEYVGTWPYSVTKPPQNHYFKSRHQKCTA